MSFFVSALRPIFDRWRLAGLVLTVGLGACVSVPAAPPGGMASHEALYDLSLLRAGNSSDVVNLQGRMEYRLLAVCDGWVSENRTALRFGYKSGEVSESLWNYVTWEAADGSRFRFDMRLIRDGVEDEVLMGEAVMAADGGSAVFEKPDGQRIELPAGTVFPTRHIIDLVEAARANRNFLSRTVFDGATLDNPYEIGGAIGHQPRRDPASELLGIFPPEPSWTMQLAFFPTTSKEPIPDVEIGGRFRADGIAEGLVQDYGDFAVKGVLVEIKKLDPPEC